MNKCHLCPNTYTKYCKPCDKWFCGDCKKDIPKRIKGFIDEKVSDFTHRVKNVDNI